MNRSKTARDTFALPTGIGLDLLGRGGIFVVLLLVIVLAAILSPAFFKTAE